MCVYIYIICVCVRVCVCVCVCVRACVDVGLLHSPPPPPLPLRTDLTCSISSPPPRRVPPSAYYPVRYPWSFRRRQGGARRATGRQNYIPILHHSYARYIHVYIWYMLSSNMYIYGVNPVPVELPPPTRGCPPREGATKLHPDAAPQLRQVYRYIDVVDGIY